MDRGGNTPRQHGGVSGYWRAYPLVGKARCLCPEGRRGNTLPDMKGWAGAQTAESQTKRKKTKVKKNQTQVMRRKQQIWHSGSEPAHYGRQAPENE